MEPGFSTLLITIEEKRETRTIEVKAFRTEAAVSADRPMLTVQVHRDNLGPIDPAKFTLALSKLLANEVMDLCDDVEGRIRLN